MRRRKLEGLACGVSTLKARAGKVYKLCGRQVPQGRVYVCCVCCMASCRAWGLVFFCVLLCRPMQAAVVVVDLTREEKEVVVVDLTLDEKDVVEDVVDLTMEEDEEELDEDALDDEEIDADIFDAGVLDALHLVLRTDPDRSTDDEEELPWNVTSPLQEGLLEEEENCEGDRVLYPRPYVPVLALPPARHDASSRVWVHPSRPSAPVRV
jgi:hypothetical protein